MEPNESEPNKKICMKWGFWKREDWTKDWIKKRPKSRVEVQDSERLEINGKELNQGR